MFSIFKKSASQTDEALAQRSEPQVASGLSEPKPSWFEQLRSGLRKTGSALTQVFNGATVDDSLFEELGVLNRDAGRRFREEILAVGGSRPAAASFRAFRGREPHVDALLRHSGMIPL